MIVPMGKTKSRTRYLYRTIISGEWGNNVNMFIIGQQYNLH